MSRNDEAEGAGCGRRRTRRPSKASEKAARPPKASPKAAGSLLSGELLSSANAVRIRRSNLFELVHDALQGPRDPRSPEERLLAERDHRQHQWRKHLNTFIAVNAGLVMMNVVMAVLSGSLVVWSIFPLIGWGIGMSIHTLNHRAWLVAYDSRLTAAEVKLGIAPSQTSMSRALPAGAAGHDPWPALLEACEKAVARATELITTVHPAASSAVSDLTAGLASVERLAEGAERINGVLRSLVADPDGLQREIDALDHRITGIDNESLKQAELANRALLMARKAKIEHLQSDRDRMLAKAKGFLLAVENLHLDAARLSGPDATEVLSSPIHRLSEEVEILRRVDSELHQLDGRAG